MKMLIIIQKTMLYLFLIFWLLIIGQYTDMGGIGNEYDDDIMVYNKARTLHVSHVPNQNKCHLYPPLSSVAVGVRGGVFTMTFARLNFRLRKHLFSSLMKQEIAFFDENHTGDIETLHTHPSFYLYY